MMVEEDSEGEELACLLSDDVDVEDGARVPVRRQFELPSVGRDGVPNKTRRANGIRQVGFRAEGGELRDSGAEEGEDFGTIDWRYYRVKARNHKRLVRTSIRGWPTPFRMIYSGYDAVQTWLALGVIGASCGVIASIIDISTDWATDIKFGFCRRGFWINRATCCSDSSDMHTCPGWYSWATPWEGAAFFYVMVAVGMGSYAAWLGWLSPYAKGSGLPEAKVILGGFVITKFLGGWTLLAKSLGLILAVGSGMSIGKEGPFVHVCMCVCNLWVRVFAKFRANEGRKRELLACAAAAGVGVAFGAPIGGVLFSLEEVSSYFPPKTMWRSFWCAIVAVLAMQGLNRNGSGKLVMFEVHYHHQWKWFEMVPFALLGVAGGLLGAFFIRCHTALLRLRKERWASLAKSPVTEVAALAALTSCIHYGVVYLQASCTGLLAALFADCQGPQAHVHVALCRPDPAVASELILAAGLKLVLTIVTATAPIPGGLLIPSLAIGGMVGRATGLWVQRLHAWLGDVWFLNECSNSTACVTPGVYAIVGAAAVLGGVTRMTVCLVVIMFEITGGLEYILPIMTAVMVAKWVGDSLGRGSVYDEAIALKGYPYLDNKAEFPHTSKVAKHVLSTTQVEALELRGNSLGSLRALLGRCKLQGFPVVTSRAELLIAGFLSRSALQGDCRWAAEVTAGPQQAVAAQGGAGADDIESAVGGDGGGEEAEVDLRPWFDVAPVQVDEEAPLDGVVEMFFALGLRYVLVTRQGRLLGIIKKKDLLAHIPAEDEQT